MKTFPTALSLTYTFEPPEFKVPSDFSVDQGDLIYVDGKGKTYGIDQRETLYPTKLTPLTLLMKMPLPTEKTEREYKITIKNWAKITGETETQVLLPVPMGFSWKRPSPPHILTQRERTPGTFEYRTLTKTFSVKTSPLYPENFMEMMHYIVEEEHPSEEFFVKPGPRGQKIPFQNHVGDSTPWYGQLIPQRPMPNTFSSYTEYEKAMKRWINRISKENVIPPNASQLQNLLGLDRQTEYLLKRKLIKKGAESISSGDYFEILSRATGFDEEEDSILNPSTKTLSENSSGNTSKKYVTSELMRIKANTPNPKKLDDIAAQLFGLHHIYSSLYIEQNHHHRPQHAKQSFQADLPVCQKLYDEWTNFGPTKPMTEKMKPKAIFYDSVSSNYPTLPNIKDIAQIKSLCSCIKSIGVRYRLFKVIIALFGKKSGQRDAIITSIDSLNIVYRLFHEFASQIKDIPIMNKSDVSDPDLQALYTILLEYYITQQLVHFFEYYNDKNAIQFLKGRNQINKRTLEDLIKAIEKTVLKKLYKITETAPDFCASCLFLFISSGDDNLNTLERNEFPFITILVKLSKVDPHSFRILQLHIFRTSALSSFVARQMAAMNYDPYYILNESSEEFIMFLSQLLIQCFPKEKVNPDVTWTMSFITMIMNQNSSSVISHLQQTLFKGICIFVQNRMWANQQLPQWKFMIPQYLTLIKAALPILLENLSKKQGELSQIKEDQPKNTIVNEIELIESSILTLLKSYRCLCWHPSSNIVIDDISGTVATLKPIISNQIQSISVSGIRTLRLIVMNHPSFLEKIVSNQPQLVLLGDAMFLRREDPLIELFKFIMFITSMPWYPKMKNIFSQLLVACHFRIAAAKSTVSSKAQMKKKETFKKFCKFLEDRPQVNQMLLDVDSQLAKRK